MEAILTIILSSIVGLLVGSLWMYVSFMTFDSSNIFLTMVPAVFLCLFTIFVVVGYIDTQGKRSNQESNCSQFPNSSKAVALAMI